MRVPGGGTSCLGVGRPGSGALPPPTARPLGGLPGPTTHWLWVRGGAGVGTRHQPHSARSCVLWGRHVGARGGRLLPGCAASGVGPSRTRDCPPSGRAAGAHYPLPVGVGGVRAWGPVTNPTARALASWLCALWGRHEGARGGRLLAGFGASGVGRSPTPDCPPSGRAAGAQYPLAVGAGGCGRGDPSPTPQRALLRAGFARCGGGTRVPGGGASWLGVGRPGSTLSHPRLRSLWAGCRGPLPTGCGCGGVRAWGPVTNPTARALASWLCALWGRHEGARGGRLLAGCGASGVGRSPTPDCPPSGQAAGAHYPLAVGAGGCGRGDPSLTPQRALLRAGFARFGGGMRAPGGVASCLGVGRPRSGASPPPNARPLGGLPGPTTHWLWVPGGAGVGTRHQPHSARSCELALRAVGAARGRPGGAPPAWVWGVRGRALSHPRLPALWAGCRGPLPTGCGCGGVRAWGPVTNPTARALACCGGGMRVPGGAPLAWVRGVRGRALPHPRLPALWAGCRGPLPTGCGCGGMRAWGPVTNPTARALASWLCALWGRHEGVWGRRLLPVCGASGVGRSPMPDCPPWRRAAGAHYPLAVGAGGCGRGDPSPGPQRALLRAGFARCGGGTRAPGGGTSCLGVGRPGSGALPPPTARPLGGVPGPTTHWLCVGEVRAWGPVTNPTERALACCWGGLWVHGAGASCLGVGRPGSGALPRPTARPLGGLPGPTTRWLWVRGAAGVGTRHQPHSARSCELALRAVGAA